MSYVATDPTRTYNAEINAERAPLVHRLGPLAGLAFAGLLALVRVIEGMGLPDSTESSTAKVVAYWTDHRSEQIAVSILATFAAVFFVWFAGYLWSALRKAEGGTGVLSALSFGGAIVTALGMLAITSVEYAVAHSAGHVPGTVTQSLSALQADTFFAVSAGFAIFGVASGIAIVRTKALASWIGWMSIVAGVLWMTPVQFLAVFMSVFFVGYASVVLARRGWNTDATV